MEPEPPTTTMTTMVKASRSEKELGVRAVIRWPQRPPATPAKNAAYDQRLELGPEDVDAQASGRHFVLADGDVLPSVGREFYLPADVDGDGQPAVDPPDIGQFIQSIESQRATGDGVHVDDQDLDDDQKAHGGHSQIVAA